MVDHAFNLNKFVGFVSKLAIKSQLQKFCVKITVFVQATYLILDSNRFSTFTPIVEGADGGGSESYF